MCRSRPHQSCSEQLFHINITLKSFFSLYIVWCIHNTHKSLKSCSGVYQNRQHWKKIKKFRLCVSELGGHEGSVWCWKTGIMRWSQIILKPPKYRSNFYPQEESIKLQSRLHSPLVLQLRRFLSWNQRNLIDSRETKRNTQASKVQHLRERKPRITPDEPQVESEVI